MAPCEGGLERVDRVKLQPIFFQETETWAGICRDTYAAVHGASQHKWSLNFTDWREDLYVWCDRRRMPKCSCEKIRNAPSLKRTRTHVFPTDESPSSITWSKPPPPEKRDNGYSWPKQQQQQQVGQLTDDAMTNNHTPPFPWRGN
ncbi:hypothetical protein EYF80_006381 [Liparis tanakae]|uniref:Uncharacterized protein n=1 Tax=Liparis tanakae TaxID=230148 RepID=A0A4Z2IZH9_9TELE|nr:hypothetical protein EYF80_006381 [Liparis tanakae]